MDILLLKVSVTAMEDSRVLLWHRDKLKLSIITDQFLQAVFDHILGRDVVKKLMQVSRHFVKSNKKVKRVFINFHYVNLCFSNFNKGTRNANIEPLWFCL